MPTLKELRTEVARIPAFKRQGALQKLGIAIAPLTAIEIIDKLADALFEGKISIDDVKSMTSHDPAQSAISGAVAEVATRAEQNALDALTKISTVERNIDVITKAISTDVDFVSRQLEKVTARLDSAESAIGSVRIDDIAITKAVSQVVADAFAPFQQAVTDANAQQTVADLANVFQVETKSVQDVFGVEVLDPKGNPLTVSIWNDPSAPAIDPHFVWTEKVLRHFILADINGDNVWLGGEKGTGKSESVRQFCARTGRAFKRINFHKYTTCEDYAGATGLVNGETKFVKGDFLMAFTHPSTCVLLDEVSNADAGELATLNGFLEQNSAVSYGGSVHRRAVGVLVFGADNTFGNGDDSGRYTGTRQMNSALMDRFAQVVRMEYLPLKDEIQAVMRHTGCNKVLAEHVVKSVRVARSKVQTADIVDAPSIRSIIAFIKALKVLNVKDAWDATIANRQPSESATALEAIRVATIDETLINNNI